MKYFLTQKFEQKMKNMQKFKFSKLMANFPVIGQ